MCNVKPNAIRFQEIFLMCFLSLHVCLSAVMSANNYHFAPSPSGLQPQHLATIRQRNRRSCVYLQKKRGRTTANSQTWMYGFVCNPCTQTVRMHIDDKTFRVYFSTKNPHVGHSWILRLWWNQLITLQSTSESAEEMCDKLLLLFNWGSCSGWVWYFG